ncbi:hypothetical protein CISIN_1g0092241mg, partial [Citrus sinensis]
MVSNQMAASTKIGIGTGIGTGTAPTHHHRVAMSTLSPLHPPLSHSNSIFLFNSTLSTRHRSLRVNSTSGPHHLPALRVRAASSVDALSSAEKSVENVVIIGSGPAGYTAAIYAARANLKPVVFEGYQAGGVPGGQLMTTTEVENFPGFPDGITGPDLMDRMRRQAERWGAELHQEDVEFIDVKSNPFTVKSGERKVKCHSIVFATGATAKRLNLPREDEFWSRGISACAICDGASPLFKGQVLAVVGGGDTATEEAIYLTKFARHVHLLVRREQLRASRAMQD